MLEILSERSELTCPTAGGEASYIQHLSRKVLDCVFIIRCAHNKYYNILSSPIGFCEYWYAVSTDISPRATSSESERFMSIMPSVEPVSMTVLISCVRFSRMRFATALLLMRSSHAGIRPPEIRGMSLCENTPAREAASWRRIWSC